MLRTENVQCLLLQGWFWFRELWGSLDWEILILDEICLIIGKGSLDWEILILDEICFIIGKGSDCELICNGKGCQI